MGRPLRYQSATPNQGLKEMTDTEMTFSGHLILASFAASNTGTGTVSVNPGVTTGLTLIGSFTDTRRPYNIGDHPVGTDVVSTTYNFYQDLRAVTNSPTRPLEYQSGENQGVKQQSDTAIENDVVRVTLDRLVVNGLGSYRLEANTPTVGGTWVAEATIKDEITGSSNTQVFLWRRTDQSAPSASRPLFYQTGANQGVKEMSNTEIQTLTNNFRNGIVNTRKGEYRLQQLAPSPGTWVSVGTISDTRQQHASNNYSGNYITNFAGNYGTSYAGNYSQAFSGNYQRFFSGFSGGFFTGFYTGFFTGFYTSFFTGFYAGTFTGFYAGGTIQPTTETVSTVSLWIRTA